MKQKEELKAYINSKYLYLLKNTNHTNLTNYPNFSTLSSASTCMSTPFPPISLSLSLQGLTQVPIDNINGDYTNLYL